MNPNFFDKGKDTPLMGAICKDNLKIVQQLLDAKADIHATNKYGQNVLYVFIHSEKMMKLLLENGATIHWQDKEGNTPLLISSATNNRDEFPKLEFYLNHGANVNHQNHLGISPIMMAVLNKQLPNVEIILNHNPDLSLKDKQGHTVWDFAEKPTNELDYQITQETSILLQTYALKQENIATSNKKIKML